MLGGLEALCCEARLRELGLFSLEKAPGDLLVGVQCLKGLSRKMETDF